MPKFLPALVAGLLVVSLVPPVGATSGIVIANVSGVSYPEQGAPVAVLPAITLTNPDGFAEGYVEVRHATAGPDSDTLSLVTVASAGAIPTTNGTVSAFDGIVYVGDGSAARQIGSVDPAKDGTGGNPLRINFTNAFPNAGFENETLTGWSTQLSQVRLGTTSLSGAAFPTHSAPARPDYTYGGTQCTNDRGEHNPSVQPISGTPSWSVALTTAQKTEGDQSLSISMSALTSVGGGWFIHGPAVVSSAFNAASGDQISFDWKAVDGGDTHSVFGYLLREQDLSTTIVIDAFKKKTGDASNWTTRTVTIPSNGDYRFVFIAGSHNADCGSQGSAQLYIDNVRVFGGVSTQNAQDVLRLIQFASTDKNPAGANPRSLIVAAAKSGGTEETAAFDVTFTPLVDDPLTVTDMTIPYHASMTAPVFGELAFDDVDSNIAVSAPSDTADVVTLDGITYDRSVSLTHGTLRYQSQSAPTAGVRPRYRFDPDVAVLEGLAASTTETVTLTATASEDSAGPGTSAAVTETATLTFPVTVHCEGLSTFDAAAFELQGDASVSGSTVTLTPDAGSKKGAIWSRARVDLSQDFCVSAEVNLGSKDAAGADGLAFVLQPNDRSELSSGGGLGYAGITPSFAIELDTFTNSGDPTEDHIALMRDGDTSDHDQWSGEDRRILTNIEDGDWRLLTLRWDATARTVTAALQSAPGSGAMTTHFSAVGADLPAHFSAASGFAYWGFTAATGGSSNLQEVRYIRNAGVVRTNAAPTFVTAPSDRFVLLDDVVSIPFEISDDSTTASQWTGPTLTTADTSVFTTAPSITATAGSGSITGTIDFVAGSTPGNSALTLTATDADGATITRTFTIRIVAQIPVTPATPPPPVAPPLPPGPVLTGGAPPRPSSTPTARVGDVEVPVASTPAGTTRQVGTTTVSTATILEVGGVSLAVDVTGAGEVRTNAGAAPEVTVVRDRVARTSGGGLLPGTQVQAWLPLGGTNARPVVSLPVAEDGTFTGELPFDGSTDRQSDGRPLPIGTHVLQLVGVDAAGQVTVIEQTVRITQPDPTPEPDRRAGAPPVLTPGMSIATNAGVPEAVTVVPVPDQRQARVEGSGWTMAVDIPSADGRVAPAEGGGALIELVEDDVAEVSGDGFLPGTRADVWLFSEPTLLGTVTIGADGTFSGTVPVEGIDTGEHTLQLQGVGTDGYVRAANLGVVVVPRATDEPAAEPEPEPEVAPEPEPEPQPEDRVEVVTAAGEDTGGSGPLVWIALLAAAAGSGWWFLLGRRRRDDEDELAKDGTTT